VSFAGITLYVASQRVFIVVVVYFVIDSIRKLLDTPSYIRNNKRFQTMNIVCSKVSVIIRPKAYISRTVWIHVKNVSSAVCWLWVKSILITFGIIIDVLIMLIFM
jgi:hypothetical protein